MSHQLILAKNNTLTDITPIVGKLSWRSNFDELGTEVNFEVAHSDTNYFPKNPIDIGDMVILKNGNFEITRCIVIKVDVNGRNPIAYKCFDLSYYLNKSKRIYQFNNISATQAITQIAKDAQIPINQIANMPKKVNKIYMNDTLSDIIKDILDQVEKETGHKFFFEMKFGKFNVYRSVDMVINPKFQLATNLTQHDITEAISNPSRKRSIEEMKNKIQLVSDGDLITELSDQSLINQYGLLSEIIELQQEDIAKARNIAKNMLNELGRVFEENSFDTLGNDTVLAGRILEVEEPVTKMSGRYFIQSVQHNVNNGIHTMSLNLKGVG